MIFGYAPLTSPIHFAVTSALCSIVNPQVLPLAVSSPPIYGSSMSQESDVSAVVPYVPNHLLTRRGNSSVPLQPHSLRAPTSTSMGMPPLSRSLKCFCRDESAQRVVPANRTRVRQDILRVELEDVDMRPGCSPLLRLCEQVCIVNRTHIRSKPNQVGWHGGWYGPGSRRGPRCRCGR